MLSDLIVIIILCILATMAHSSRKQYWGWLNWFLRSLFALFMVGEIFSYLAGMTSNKTASDITLVVALITGAILFMPVRKGLSVVLTCINQLVSLEIINAYRKKRIVQKADVELVSAEASQSLSEVKAKGSGEAPGGEEIVVPAKAVSPWLANRVFVPDSMPHLTALWVYVTCLGYILGNINLNSFNLPALPIPIPVPIDQLFSYNGLGLIMLALFGVGIFVTRKPKEALKRLGLVKPSWMQVGIGVLMIFFTFAYDWVWSLYTHQMGNIGGQLSSYNAGTFTGGGDALSAFLLALSTGVFAGMGEETLIRGALQPVFGILPAGFLHGALHGQFAHAPIYILQVAGWSTIMGIVRHYTNTTTTMISHVGFNFLTTFLFAFNP